MMMVNTFNANCNQVLFILHSLFSRPADTDLNLRKKVVISQNPLVLCCGVEVSRFALVLDTGKLLEFDNQLVNNKV